MKYKVNEHFYSIQGEGFYTGTAMYFIRLSGCNLRCDFCDTKHETFQQIEQDDLIKEVCKTSAQKVVITGGEPLIHELVPLTKSLFDKGLNVHLETNGTLLIDGFFNWITVSPKSHSCVGATVRGADEIKFLCGPEGWYDFINGFMRKFNLFPQDKRHYYLQPLDGPLKKGWTEVAVAYILSNPWMKLSPQVHKYLEVK